MRAMIFPPFLVVMVHPECEPDHVGFIPTFLDPLDPKPAKEQFDAAYVGGWRPVDTLKMRNTGKMELYSTKYPDDEPYPLLALFEFRDEKVLIWSHAWVTIVHKDGTYETSRMD